MLTALFGTVSFWLAWIAGGFYYAKYYGQNVKPIITAGRTPWVHTVLMETKEHLFLFLPFLSITGIFLLWRMNKEIDANAIVRKWTALLLTLIIVLGLIMAFSGILISSAGGR